MIKINKFLAASVVTLSLAACDLAPYSSIAVYADQAAKVVCDERYWVAARSGPGTEYELEHKLSNGKDITILEQTTGADGKTRIHLPLFSCQNIFGSRHSLSAAMIGFFS